MKNSILFSLVLLIAVAFLGGCKKEGIGGNSEVSFHVKHHSTTIPFAKVYIKYDSKEFPGTDVTVYDDSTTTDAAAHGHFHDLVKGDYYLYGVGYDSSISQVVKGGVPVNLKTNEELEVDVPVTE
jgi:hypothetical protein